MTDAARKAVLDEKRNVSSKISETTRYIGFGLIAAVYGVLTSDSSKIDSLFDASTTLLVISAVAGAVAIVFDYMQFVFGYWSVRQALRASDSKYNEEYFAYKLRARLFWLKQGFAFAGALLFTVVLISSVFRAT